ncbi:tryptophan--tRNA ligase, mitochondrial [Chelonus insularis]|uniref:tryptophan--tRNA ligase, mitochondrial n=1 Tax=Chelonus insularis TaxID=460826 RepID=UPI001589F6A7|nr:tryptophan--tRNA ligase, mitochondrial [Chelonus insularis]
MIKSHILSINNILKIRQHIKVKCCVSRYCTKVSRYPKRIFSGIQPSGTIHLGNYLGAIKQWVNFQDSMNPGEDILCCIVDMHAITLPQDPKILRENILTMIATMLACGINTDKTIVFQQSSISMHAELAWVLGCCTTLPKLSQLPQYKDKSEKLKTVPLGLLTYPILQAADILLYKATHVPIGEDQLQHLHLTQHIVNYFNGKYGKTFPIPQPLVDSSSGRIKSLREPLKKMSKSSEYKKSCINLTDPPDVIRQYIKKAVTDMTSNITYDPQNRPGVSNLINIHSLLTDKSHEVICEEAIGLDTGKYKLIVADVVIEKLTPIRQEYFKLINDPAYLLNVLNNGTLKALPLANQCWTEVKRKLGFSGGILSLKNWEKDMKKSVL